MDKYSKWIDHAPGSLLLLGRLLFLLLGVLVLPLQVLPPLLPHVRLGVPSCKGLLFLPVDGFVLSQASHELNGLKRPLSLLHDPSLGQSQGHGLGDVA